MIALTLSEKLKFANLQMAAEAYWNARTAPIPLTPVEVLTAGNGRASRFTTAAAEQFAADWEVVAHKDNAPSITGGSGTDVIDIGRVPTPVTYFAAHHLGVGSCVSVTGSHNPPNYNGLKMVLGGQTLFGGQIRALRHRIVKGDLNEGEGQSRSAKVEDAYLDRIIGDIKLSRPMKIVVDCGNGVAGELAPKLFRRLGCEVVELFCKIE